MLSLWKLRVGAEDYYLSQVARGLDDYYSGHGETPGRWLGNAAGALGLSGEVSAEDLRAVMAGFNPGAGQTPNGGPLRTWRNRVPGFDLTFSAPKSVSVLYALGDPLVRGTVVDALDAAMDTALGWLEREACFVRRGSNNQAAHRGPSEGFGTRRLRGGGFVAAGFRHRTSRAGDPQLHTHVLVANLARGPDRRWSALDAQAIYRSRRAAGAVYDHAVRDELTGRLGVRWVPVGGDNAEIAGIPRRVLRLFSKRRVEIEAALKHGGLSGPKAAEAVTLETRGGKAEVDGERLDARWQEEAATVGYSPADIDGLLANTDRPDARRQDPQRLIVVATDPDTGERLERDVDMEQFGATVAEALVERDSTFTRHQVTVTITTLLRSHTSPVTLDRLTDVVLGQPHLVPLPNSPGAAAGWEQRWTSRRLVRLEADLLAALQLQPGSHAALPQEWVESLLGSPEFAALGGDQRDTVRRVTTQGLAVEVVVGRAGTGKTYTMNAARRLFEGAGYRLIGVAPSGLAARGLAEGAGIDSYTIPRFMLHAAAGLTQSDVVVVDEAGMVGTVDLHRVVTAARSAGAKVILVGDHHQLPEIAAGGGFATAVAAGAGYTAELTVNRRQREPWEVHALDELRHGQVATAFAAYQTHGRVLLRHGDDEVRAAAVAGWWRSYRAGRHAVLLAGTRGDAHLLNQAARDQAAAAGLLHGPVLEVHDRQFQAGDRVLLRRNDGHQHDLDRGRRCRVDNGMIATITHVHDFGDVDVRLVNGRRIRLDWAYVAAGRLDHGYAVTIHKAQGITCDEVFVVGPAGLYREAVYVAMSRARYAAWIYAATRDATLLAERHHSTGIPLPTEVVDDPEHDLCAALQTSQAKQLATAIAPHLTAIADQANTVPLDRLWERHTHIRAVTRNLVKSGHADPVGAVERLTRARIHRQYLHVGGRVRALDWDNVGGVVAIADRTGTVLVHFDSPDGRTADKWMHWADTKPIDHPEHADLPHSAVQYFAVEEAAIAEETAVWNRLLAGHGITPDQPVIVSAAIEQRSRQVAHRLAGDNPDWLQWWLGPRPTDLIGAQVWDDEIAAVAAWRDARHLRPDVAGYGPQPAPQHADRWRDHLTRSLQIRGWLRQHQPGLDREPVPLLEPVEIRQRLDELDAVLATAPSDQTRIIAAIRTGTLTPGDIHLALSQALATQHARRDWILEHWPHVIEHAELTRLAQQHRPLAHWPTPLHPDAQHLLDTLATISTDTTERRTLTELDELLAAADPRHHLRSLQRQLDQLDATIEQLTDERTTVNRRHPERARMLDDHLAELRRQHDHIREEHRRHSALGTLWGSGHRPRQLVDATTRRSSHLAHTAITEGEQWVVETVRAWHHTHPRNDNPAELHRLITGIAAWRERAGHAGSDPIGDQPQPGSPHLDGWQQLHQRLRKAAKPLINHALH